MKFLQRLTVLQWARIGVFNLLLVAAMGTLMRLKFLLPMPWVNLKYLQHAHSHFAFVGWVSHALMLCMVAVTFRLQKDNYLPKHQEGILWVNLFCSFGMLFSFVYQGYGAISITFSTISIVVSYVFAWCTWHDMRSQQLDRKIFRWFAVALVFLVFSSLGTFYLAYLMATQNFAVKEQLAAVYFYLHFQYNGWFFFAIMGLAFYLLKKYGIVQRHGNLLYYVFLTVTVPLYLLSVLWWDMGNIVYVLLVVAVLVQLGVWLYWMWGLSKNNRHLSAVGMNRYLRTVLWLVCFAILIKFFLQALSVIPSLSQFVYGFRPVIIGYLHLVLLLIVSVFALTYMYQESYLKPDRITMVYYSVFLFGAVLNEVFLALQASMALLGAGFLYAHWYLMGASMIMVFGLLGMLFCSFAKDQDLFPIIFPRR